MFGSSPPALPFGPITDGRTPTFVEVGAAPSTTPVFPPMSVAKHGTDYYVQLGTLASPSWKAHTLIPVLSAALTAGRVPYVAAGGLLADDSALQWDAANNCLGIGGVPNTAFHLHVQASAADAIAVVEQATASRRSLIQARTDTGGNYAEVGAYGSTYGASSFGSTRSNTTEFVGALTTKLGTVGAFPLILGTGDTEAFRIDTSQRLQGGTAEATAYAYKVGIFGTSGLVYVSRHTTNDLETVLGNDGSTGFVGTATAHGFIVQTGVGGVQRLLVDALGNIVPGTAALATTATDGFVHVTTSAGPPTGVPTAHAGRVPLHFDTTNDKIYVYRGGWKSTAALT